MDPCLINPFRPSSPLYELVKLTHKNVSGASSGVWVTCATIKLHSGTIFMKRSKRKTNQKKKPANAPSAKPEVASDSGVSRRDFMSKLQYGALGVAVVGGGSWYLVNEVMASSREHDLSRLGNGMPTVVQIHDPSCPRCTALQRETRDALGAFGDKEIQYLIADITRPEGRRFATIHRVNHVTLLLFDGKGERRGTLVGPNDADTLQQVFKSHLDRYGAG